MWKTVEPKESFRLLVGQNDLGILQKQILFVNQSIRLSFE